MTDITTACHHAAEIAYEEFEFEQGSEPVAANGWEDDGLGNLTRVIFVADAEDPSAGTVKGQFNVSFDAGSTVPDQVWATVDGNDIARRLAPAVQTSGM